MPLIKLHVNAFGRTAGEVFEREFVSDAEIAWYHDAGVLSLAEEYEALPVQDDFDSIRAGSGPVRQVAAPSQAQLPTDGVRRSPETYDPNVRSVEEVVAHLDGLSEDDANYLEIRRILNLERAGLARVGVTGWEPPVEAV